MTTRTLTTEEPMQTETLSTIHDLAIETIRQPTDAHLACVADCLTVGTRVAYPPLPEPRPLSRALVEAMWSARGWR